MTTTHYAACSCGQLHAAVAGDPIRVSLCNCLACQRRTGSAFGLQSRFTSAQVQLAGRSHEYLRVSDDGEQRLFRFCPDCGATVYFSEPHRPEAIAIPLGAFADPMFPAPSISIYEDRMHEWLTLPAAMHHHD